jgi:hypothetical protein
VPANSLEDVKLNYTLIDFLQVLEEQPMLRDQRMLSESCGACDEKAEWYCVEEAVSLCAQHMQQAHSLPFQKLHTVCVIEEKQQRQHAQPPVCKQHHMPMIFWCECKVRHIDFTTHALRVLCDDDGSNNQETVSVPVSTIVSLLFSMRQPRSAQRPHA